ncbi:alpha/beta fold hydrolase [uncultured Erythrobacter sp.]|uniref:alpha/beta fold hydrolase n=1 Tax=uncultured Erythrobacter sp. TaxID=263913 RepID=UPI0026195411|nr:alpha/beta fold hydrolase [uncultured Erythrobacter sp.]
MKRILLNLLLVLIVAGSAYVFYLTRDGSSVTPEGSGTVSTAGGEFEGFTLPDYAAAALTDDYKSYFVEVEPGVKIHVLEVGEGYPVYLQHGNPTNGMLYRKVAAGLPHDQFRLIMPTMVGLGFSTKVPASEHTLENHIRWMTNALDQIGVAQVIYVGQDWGGPVGMGVMARSPDLLQGVVAMNTGFTAPKEERSLSAAHDTVSTPIVGELMLEGIGSIWSNLASVQGDPASMPKDVIDLYSLPVEDSGNAKAPLALMRMVPNGPDHPSSDQMREIEAYVATLDVPAALVWGMNDPILAQGLDSMRAQFPEASVIETEAGHFLQEEVPAEIAAAIIAVHARIDTKEGNDAGAEPVE